MVKRALTPADAAEIEPERRKAPMHEGVVELVDDRVVHCPAELRMRVQNDSDWRIFLPGRMLPSLDAPGGAGEDNLRHSYRPRTDLAAVNGGTWMGCGLADQPDRALSLELF